MRTMKTRKTIGRDRKSISKAARTGRHPAFGALRDVTRLVPGVDLTEPAEPKWEKLFFGANEWWIDPPKPPDSKG